MRPPIGVAIAIGLGLLGARTASAQEGPEVSVEYNPDFDPEQFQASSDPEQIGLVDGARTQPMGTLAAGVVFNLAGPPLDIRVTDRGCDPAVNPECKSVAGDIINTRLRADLGVLYGLGRFDVRLSLPFVLDQSSDFAPQAGAEPLASNGVGNPRVGLRAQLVKRGPLALAGDIAVQIPTGGRNFIGDDALVIDPRVLVDVHAGRVWAGVNLGYRYRGGAEGSHLANLYVDDELTWSAAAQYWVMPRTFAVGAAAYGKLGVMDAPSGLMDVPGVVQELGSEERPAELLGSARWFVTDKLAIDLGGGTALSPGYGAPPFRVLAGVRWIDRKAARPPRIALHPPEPEPEVAVVVPEPDPDRDDDGLLDAVDACVDEAEDLDGLQDGDGCPEADADGDGIADQDDRCPLEAEIYNGTDDEDGCADTGGPEVILTPGAVVITEKIYFDLNRARIKTRSQPVLNAVAGILTAHSELRIRIEGHTDDQGARDWNRTLSQLRSERVREYLIKKGIAPERLEAQGFGYDRPLVDDTTETAREQNRRVEFIIIGRDGAETGPGEELSVPPGGEP